jgi:tripartite-type tricarboxylate transporter receptor subunit TctC
LSESGLPDFNVSAFFGLAAPAGLPADVRQRLEAALEKIARDPAVVAPMERAGADVAYLNSAASAAFMAADAATWKRVVAFASVKVD